jgi:hypothetical protein
VWKGLNPPAIHGYFRPAVINVLIVGAIIGLLAIPLVIGCIRWPPNGVLPERWGVGSTVVASAALFILIITQLDTQWPEGGSGGGIIVKAGLRMGSLGTPFILTVSYFGLIATIVFAMRSLTNTLLAGAFMMPYLVSIVIYQHYLEPTLTVACFLFADTKTAQTMFNKHVLVCNFAFTAAILVTGILYYDFVIISPNRITQVIGIYHRLVSAAPAFAPISSGTGAALA